MNMRNGMDMELILSAIIGGLIVLAGIKFAPRRMLMKNLFKIYYVAKDHFLSASGELLEKTKDLAAESRAEYDREKKEEKGGEAP